MVKTLYWVQCGACSGDSMSMLSMESPNILELQQLLHIETLWHPSLSYDSPVQQRQLIDAILSGERKLDILCVEGTIIRGPGGTGIYDLYDGKPKKNIVAALARMADYVVAVGTCASFGGIAADGEVEGTGLQFHKRTKGGFLGKNFRTSSGLPVINLPGCPCHPGVLADTFATLAHGMPIEFTEYNAPCQWYSMLVHQGCLRNEYHEYRVEEKDFGERGCLFFYMGCQGPLTYGPCNKLLWNRRNSKMRAGIPCFGCTSPDFPLDHPFFKTPSIADVPLNLPDGVDRAHYLAYKGISAAAAPERLKQRKTRI